MGHVLTITDNVTCGHNGKVITSTLIQKLTVNGNPVLVKSSVEGQNVVVGPPGTPNICTITPDTSKGFQPCTKVSRVTGGEAGKLQVGGNKVLLQESLHGETDGLDQDGPQTKLSATSGQRKLTAV